MKTAIELSEMLFGYGIDIIVILSILAIVQGTKKYLKIKKKTAFLILIALGLITGILKIVLKYVTPDMYFTVIFGYAGLTTLLYITIDIFLPAIKNKYFPSAKDINEAK